MFYSHSIFFFFYQGAEYIENFLSLPSKVSPSRAQSTKCWIMGLVNTEASGVLLREGLGREPSSRSLIFMQMSHLYSLRYRTPYDPNQ